MTKVDYRALIQADLDKGFTKSQLERLIGLPKNSLTYTLSGSKDFSKISMLKIDKWDVSEKPSPLDLIIQKKKTEENGRNNPFENAARGRDENGINNDEILDVDGSVKPTTKKGDDKIKEMISNMKASEIPRLKGESSIEYRLRCIEINEKKNKNG